VSYRFRDDVPTADVGFVASGASLGECFRSAADATLATMLSNPDSLVLRERFSVHVEDEALDLALVKLLEELVYHKDARSLFLKATEVTVGRAQQWTIDAVLEGEAIDPTRHQLSNDVKAVTVHGLSVRETGAGWEARVVLDV
jgi:SHS2 domain-containing protein